MAVGGFGGGLKPLYERVLVGWLGSVVAGEAIGVWQAQRAMWARGWWAELLWRRFFVRFRVMRHAVCVLEGGEDLRARMEVVSALGGLGRWVVGLALMGAVVWVSGVVVFPWRLDWFGVLDGLMRDGLDFLALNRGILWALVLWWVLVSWGMSVVFVCVGFAFYLQGRMQLEGWGIGLGLKALARRLAVVVVLGWLGLGLRGEAVWAMSEEERQAYRARVQGVMEAPEVSPYGWQVKKMGMRGIRWGGLI
ncbi:hypothetical protein [Rappaport israeli]|uniref:hypothetical protein n=1 Tax=Rappaport israeli TaxID=1839807 RepID=UPI00117873D7|nr:hypothetical protein [Rappaport israeli]